MAASGKQKLDLVRNEIPPVNRTVEVFMVRFRKKKMNLVTKTFCPAVFTEEIRMCNISIVENLSVVSVYMKAEVSSAAPPPPLLLRTTEIRAKISPKTTAGRWVSEREQRLLWMVSNVSGR